MDVRLSRHFWDRYHRVGWQIPRFLLSDVGSFLKEQGLFYVSFRAGEVFVSAMGAVFVLRKSGSRFVVTTVYPGDYRLQRWINAGVIKPVDPSTLEGKDVG